MQAFTFVGVPIDSVGRSGGTEHAPAKLRELGLADILATTMAIREATAAALSSGELPFLAGGCCAELPGALAGSRDVLGRIGVAYLDGHLDLYDGMTSPTGEGADMPLSVALGRGPAAWVDVCGGSSARVEDVVPIGYRDSDELPTYSKLAPELGPGFRPISKEDVRTEGPVVVGERTAAALAASAGRYWLHLDVDILGEDVFPATDYLMPNGLNMDELVALMRPLAISTSLAGASLGCYNPEKDPGDVCSRALVEAFAAAFST